MACNITTLDDFVNFHHVKGSSKDDFMIRMKGELMDEWQRIKPRNEGEPYLTDDEYNRMDRKIDLRHAEKILRHVKVHTKSKAPSWFLEFYGIRD